MSQKSTLTKIADGTLATTGLRRGEVIGTPIASQVFALVDAIWLQDKRLFSLVVAERETPD